MIFAVIHNKVISRIVSADNKEILKFFFPDADCIVLVTDKTGPASVGGDILNGEFRSPSPYKSWIWDTKKSIWKPPISYPKDGSTYCWDEKNIEWYKLVIEKK